MNCVRNWLPVILISSLLAMPQFLAAQDMPLTQVLIEGEDWQSVAKGHRFTDGLTTDADGNLYFADVAAGTTINRIGLDGKLTAVADNAPRISGMHFGPDGRIYACQGGSFGRIVAFDLEAGKMEVVAENVKPNDLVVTSDGHIYFTETGKMQVSHIAPGGKLKTPALSGCLCFGQVENRWDKLDSDSQEKVTAGVPSTCNPFGA